MLRLYINIKERRRDLGLSQEELAKKVGYRDRTSIAKIEAGEVDLSQSRIDAFAQALETTPAYLMGWDDEETQTGKGILIPIVGSIPAGVPIEDIEDIVDSVLIPEELSLIHI